MPDRNDMVAPAVFIIVKSDREVELTNNGGGL
ncbi:MAG: hypothetical protein H6Q04_2433 [Acidobacteria bacterium]|nr:hypothetical protein [Acidobacteriota bacterium]